MLEDSQTLHPTTSPIGLVTDSAEAMAEALGAHFVMWHDLPAGGPPGEWRCQCGKKFGFSDPAIQHVAAALIASGTVRPAAEVQAEALQEAADYLEAWFSHRSGPAVVGSGWLRARADDIRRTQGGDDRG